MKIRPAMAATLLLLVFIAVLFFPALFQGKLLAPLDITTTLLPPWGDSAHGPKPHNQSPSDAVSQYLPYRLFAEKSLREDGYIGWNPYEMGGYSLAANTMALPGSWPVQLHRWLPFKDAWNLGIMAEFLIAGSGMLIFLRSRKLSWLPCLIGTVAFMLNAQFIVWIYHRWALGSFCWMPWVCWAFADGFSSKLRSRRTLLLPVFIALALLGGSLQHLAFVVFACGCLAAGSFDFRRPFQNLSLVVGWGVAMLLAFGIAAFSLVPQISGYLSNLAIGHTRGGIGYEDGLSQVFYHALLIPARIWPWLAGDPQSMDGFRILKAYYMELNYMGTVPMILGFAGLFIPGLPRAAKWLIAVGLLTPLTPLVGPLYHRVELLFILGAAWMTAEMLQNLSSSVKRSSHSSSGSFVLLSRLPWSWQKILLSAIAGIGFVLLVATCLPSGVRKPFEEKIVSLAVSKSRESQFGADQEWIRIRALEWTSRFSLLHPRTAWVYGLLVVGGSGLVLASRSHKGQVRAGHLMILGATSLELATLFQTWTTFSNPSDLLPQNAAIETVRSLAGNHRVLQCAPDTGFASIFATPNLLAAQSIPSIDAYESIQYRSTLTATRDFPAELSLTLAHVGIAIHPHGKQQPGTEVWPVVATIQDYSIRKNPHLFSSVVASHEALPETPPEILTALTTATPIPASLHTANRWNLEIPAGKNWLRIAQNWHEGWKWRVPGQAWSSFAQGSDSCCWIPKLPAQADKIEVQFFPRSSWLTGTSILVCALWFCLFMLLSAKIATRDPIGTKLP